MADGDLYLPAACEAQAFKDGLSRWVTGVALVTCRAEGSPFGVAVSSFTSVSTTPPRVLYCIAKSGRSAPALQGAIEVGINLLPEGAEAMAAAFSGGVDPYLRFTTDAWDLDPRAPPRLYGALAHFRGAVRSRLDAGSHDIVIVDVQSVVLGEGSPLLYAARAYRRLHAG